jgi:3-mercaptopyruvate sulfurtransferase SseA
MAGANGASDFAASGVSIAATGNGTSQAVAIGQSNGLMYHNLRNADGTWTGWHALPGASGAADFGGPAVTIAGYAGGTSRVLAIGLDDAIHENTRNTDGTWTGWTTVSAGPVINLAAAALPDNTLQLVEIQ